VTRFGERTGTNGCRTGVGARSAERQGSGANFAKSSESGNGSGVGRGSIVPPTVNVAGEDELVLKMTWPPVPERDAMV